MNKIIICAALMAITATSFGQQTNPSKSVSREDYLKKSKTQKTIAWILVGTGVGLVVTAFATTSLDDAINSVQGDEEALNSSATLLAIGGITALSSIPLFIASGRNKRKGMSLSFKNETAPQIQNNSFVYRSVPSVSLKISL